MNNGVYNCKLRLCPLVPCHGRCYDRVDKGWLHLKQWRLTIGFRTKCPYLNYEQYILQNWIVEIEGEHSFEKNLTQQKL